MLWKQLTFTKIVAMVAVSLAVIIAMIISPWIPQLYVSGANLIKSNPILLSSLVFIPGMAVQMKSAKQKMLLPIDWNVDQTGVNWSNQYYTLNKFIRTPAAGWLSKITVFHKNLQTFEDVGTNDKAWAFMITWTPTAARKAGIVTTDVEANKMLTNILDSTDSVHHTSFDYIWGRYGSNGNLQSQLYVYEKDIHCPAEAHDLLELRLRIEVDDTATPNAGQQEFYIEVEFILGAFQSYNQAKYYNSFIEKMREGSRYLVIFDDNNLISFPSDGRIANMRMFFQNSSNLAEGDRIFFGARDPYWNSPVTVDPEAGDDLKWVAEFEAMDGIEITENFLATGSASWIMTNYKRGPYYVKKDQFWGLFFSDGTTKHPCYIEFDFIPNRGSRYVLNPVFEQADIATDTSEYLLFQLPDSIHISDIEAEITAHMETAAPGRINVQIFAFHHEQMGQTFGNLASLFYHDSGGYGYGYMSYGAFTSDMVKLNAPNLIEETTIVFEEVGTETVNYRTKTVSETVGQSFEKDSGILVRVENESQSTVNCRTSMRINGTALAHTQRVGTNVLDGTRVIRLERVPEISGAIGRDN